MKSNIDFSKITQDIKEKIRQFSVATGIRCIYMTMDSRQGQEAEACQFCMTVSRLTENHIDCHNSLLYGAYQSERFGGKYIFYCPMGLVHFASPVYVEGNVFAVAVGGPVLIIDKDEFISEDIIGKYKIDESHAEKLCEEIYSIPRVQPERVTALSEVLFSVCASISGTHQMQFISDEEAIGNEMAKYINLINTMGGDYGSTYPIEKERELLALISIGDKKQSQELLDDILCHIIAYSNNEFKTVKARVLELAVLLSRAALEGGADLEQIFGLNFSFLTQINEYRTVEELANWLSKIMSRFTDCVFNIVSVKHIDIIYKSVDYIKRNFSRKITLEEVASYVFLSPSYFSKIFKAEMNVSFNNYLNQIRIEKSKSYLLNSELDLIQIAEMVGFEDQSYFTKVFKKLTGVTPGKYRQRHGKN